MLMEIDANSENPWLSNLEIINMKKGKIATVIQRLSFGLLAYHYRRMVIPYGYHPIGSSQMAGIIK